MAPHPIVEQQGRARAVVVDSVGTDPLRNSGKGKQRPQQYAGGKIHQTTIVKGQRGHTTRTQKEEKKKERKCPPLFRRCLRGSPSSATPQSLRRLHSPPPPPSSSGPAKPYARARHRPPSSLVDLAPAWFTQVPLLPDSVLVPVHAMCSCALSCDVFLLVCPPHSLSVFCPVVSSTKERNKVEGE